MVIIKTNRGTRVKIDPDDDLQWEIFEADSRTKIGFLDVDGEGMIVGVEIAKKHQRKGIATAVIKYLVEECGYEFYFWPPDGQTYNDARHLSEEGARLANSLVKMGLARWIAVGPCEYDEPF